VNRKLASKLPAALVIDELEQEPMTKQSAVLEEKLGDLYFAEGTTPKAIAAYTAALKLETTQQQRLRIMLSLAQALNVALREREAYDLYKRILKSFPDYPDPASIYHKLRPWPTGWVKTRRRILPATDRATGGHRQRSSLHSEFGCVEFQNSALRRSCLGAETP
jgi:tetratricopeptide (TPR) repeat protein